MRLVRLLPDRWQKFVHEALKFGLVGGINTIINYAVFNALALTVFADGQLKATVIATVVATITSYLMNRHWTYRDRPKSAMRREYALFFLFNATGLLIELGVLALAKYGLGITSLLAINLAKTAGLVLGTAFRFWSYRTFVFRSSPADHAPPTPAEGGTTAAAAAGTATGVLHGEVHGEVLAELDPVAELAEAVTELTESPPTPADPADTSSPSDPAGTDPAELDPVAELAETIDVELEAELAAAELAPTSRRPTAG